VYRLGPAAAPEQLGAASVALPLPDKPSIAVLPFANMSGDPEQEYFGDGMVEENTTQNPDPSNSAAFTAPARCQVDSLMDFLDSPSTSLYNLKPQARQGWVVF